jgi:hypothetical protein
LQIVKIRESEAVRAAELDEAYSSTNQANK